jgi:hypothetical protein
MADNAVRYPDAFPSYSGSAGVTPSWRSAASWRRTTSSVVRSELKQTCAVMSHDPSGTGAIC